MPLNGFLGDNGMFHQLEAPGLHRAKRKLWTPPEIDTDSRLDMLTTEANDCPAKRCCLEIQVPDVAGNPESVIQEQYQNVCCQLKPSSFHQMQEGEVYGCLKDVASSLEMSASFFHEPATPPSQINIEPMMMDGEIYSRLHSEDLDIGNSDMESDHFPESEQDKPKLEFCSTPCLGGLRSPVSNIIRCHCRSWDLRDIMPYISDYY